MADPTSLTLTNAELAELAEGLSGLDGLRVKGELEPFLFCPELTWVISDNQVIVSDRLRAFNKAKKSLASQHGITEGMAVTAAKPEQLAAFFGGVDTLMETVVTIDGLKKISRAKLNVGHDKKKEQNTIPPSALAKLAVILED